MGGPRAICPEDDVELRCNVSTCLKRRVPVPCCSSPKRPPKTEELKNLHKTDESQIIDCRSRAQTPQALRLQPREPVPGTPQRHTSGANGVHGPNGATHGGNQGADANVADGDPTTLRQPEPKTPHSCCWSHSPGTPRRHTNDANGASDPTDAIHGATRGTRGADANEDPTTLLWPEPATSH